MKKNRPFVPVGNTNRDKRVRQPRGRWLHLLSRLVLPTGTKGPLLSRLPHPGQKGTPLLSRTGVPGWETGTTAVSQPGQINVFVVVNGKKLSLHTSSVDAWATIFFWKKDRSTACIDRNYYKEVGRWLPLQGEAHVPSSTKWMPYLFHSITTVVQWNNSQTHLLIW